MRTERERELAREYRRRLHVKDAHHPRLPSIMKLTAQGLYHREIAAVLGFDRSRVSQILRAVRAARLASSEEREAA